MPIEGFDRPHQMIAAYRSGYYGMFVRIERRSDGREVLACRYCRKQFIVRPPTWEPLGDGRFVDASAV